MRDYDMSIHRNIDARAWARFYRESKEQSPDPSNFDEEDNMIGWFANAMMAMYDHVMGAQITVLDDGSAFFIGEIPDAKEAAK